MNPTSLASEAEYRAALDRLYEVFNAEPGTPEETELLALADQVEAYEAIHYPIDTSDVKSLQEERAEALLKSEEESLHEVMGQNSRKG